MNFEWDEQKNRENIRKHGLDLSDAWKIFQAPLVIDLDLRTDYGEDRLDCYRLAWQSNSGCHLHTAKRTNYTHYFVAEGINA